MGHLSQQLHCTNEPWLRHFGQIYHYNQEETRKARHTTERHRRRKRGESQQPKTKEETGSRGAPPAAPSPRDPSDTTLCERVMHPAWINVSSVTKQGLGYVSCRSRKGIRINSLRQGTDVKLNRCCNCVMYHEFLIVDILL